MTVTNDLQELMTDEVIWSALGSRDSYGNPTFVNPYSYPARLVRKNKLVRDKDMQEVVSTAQVWIGPSLTSGEPFPAVAPVDQVTLSDGTNPQILNTEIFQDETFSALGPSHCVVYFV